ncbi:uncharacterized protein MJAP1_003645 [Malassezia japonica]|uniref:Uncharacterized protein n=1 Tax=Malassezia japonica TaxID=223818 RepID=A0AAF0F996_9BASI|nr:uncharacterized protein MJAP1_003645 [Malassezia japonica]WFD40657.1 hypothetical protein MJAP1_003645 [Malassezia japonica]
MDVLRLVVLCGVVGSGKSTLACAIEEADPEHWVRCNQDELKKRAIVQRHAMNALQEGKNVLIDRTNIDYRQRAEWLELANEFRAAHPDGPRLVTCLVWVDTPIDVCKKRLAARTGHPTIKDAQSAMRQRGSMA